MAFYLVKIAKDFISEYIKMKRYEEIKKAKLIFREQQFEILKQICKVNESYPLAKAMQEFELQTSSEEEEKQPEEEKAHEEEKVPETENL